MIITFTLVNHTLQALYPTWGRTICYDTCGGVWNGERWPNCASSHTNCISCEYDIFVWKIFCNAFWEMHNQICHECAWSLRWSDFSEIGDFSNSWTTLILFYLFNLFEDRFIIIIFLPIIILKLFKSSVSSLCMNVRVGRSAKSWKIVPLLPLLRRFVRSFELYLLHYFLKIQ